jgi:hypothetical protein
VNVLLSEVLEEQFSHVRFDSKLAKAVYHYQVGYVNSSKDYLEFFGGNLLGVQRIRFKDSDVTRFFDEVLNVDYYHLNTELKKVSDINHTFKVASDTLNLTLLYVIHKFATSKLINDTIKYEGMYNTALIFFYRCMAALISDYFKFQADPNVVQTAYANLSNKYLIKQLGNWQKVMDYRASELVALDGLHRDSIVKFPNGEIVMRVIADSQGRIRDMIKNYYSEIDKAKKQGDIITTTSSTYLDLEGEETIKEKTKSIESHITYMRNIIIDKHSFINEDLLGVINRINTNTSYKKIRETLAWMSDHSNEHKFHNLIDEFLSLTIIHSFYLIQNQIPGSNLRDYPHILNNLKNLYLSTRSSDAELEKIRELGAEIVKLSSHKKAGESLIMATRTSVILYISLRTLVGTAK